MAWIFYVKMSKPFLAKFKYHRNGIDRLQWKCRFTRACSHCDGRSHQNQPLDDKKTACHRGKTLTSLGPRKRTKVYGKKRQRQQGISRSHFPSHQLCAGKARELLATPGKTSLPPRQGLRVRDLRNLRLIFKRRNGLASAEFPELGHQHADTAAQSLDFRFPNPEPAPKPSAHA